MAITGALFNTLTFGNVNSGDYGIYISGEGVFDAPARDVEMISVPGRNGDIALDLGRYENITVEYPAGVFGDDNVDFRERLSDFRNAVLSQKGYQRLSDTYHPDEFRMGVYASGLEVAPVNYNEAGEFKLSFNCKPQRFLVAGEEEITVTSGDTIENPTLFDSEPILNVRGRGELTINGEKIILNSASLEPVPIFTNYQAPPSFYEWTITIPDNKIGVLNNGDSMTVDFGVMEAFETVTEIGIGSDYFFSGASVEPPSLCSKQIARPTSNKTGTLEWSLVTFNLVYGTPQSISHNMELVVYVRSPSDPEGFDFNQTRTLNIEYDGDAEITFSLPNNNELKGNVGGVTYTSYITSRAAKINSLLAITSTQNLNPIIMNLGDGVVYALRNGEILNINNLVEFPSDLPKLKPGDNVITFDNTILDFKLFARWWKL